MMLWWIFSLLIVVAVIFLVLPLLGVGSKRSHLVQDRVNAQIFRERLEELETFELEPAALQTARSELEKNLALELDDAPPPNERPWARHTTAAIVALALPLLAIGGYWWSSADTRAMLAAQNKTQTQHAQAGSMSMDDVITRLRQRLEQTPDDPKGWDMLARSYLALERYPEASQAYEKLVNLSGGKDPQVLADYAESLALINNENLTGRPEQLLTQTLELDPNHPKALWLMGMAAMQQQQTDNAASYWQRLLSILPVDSEDYAFLYTQLDKRNKLPESATPPHLAAADVAAQQPPDSPPQSTTPAAPATGQVIRVAVRLSASLTAQTSPTDTLFIYARAAQGPRMPLAIVRKQVQNLPLEVTLDDSMGMVPGMSLSAFPEIIVAARISKSGQAIAQRGDLLGESSTLKAAEIANTVQIEIGQVVE